MENSKANQETHDPSSVCENRGLNSVEEGGKKHVDGEVEAATEAVSDALLDSIKFANGNIPEKVVFCVDGHFGNLYRQDYKTFRRILFFISAYIELKQKVNVKPVEFAILVMSLKSCEFIPISSKKALLNAMTLISNIDVEETGAYDLSEMFICLAEMAELPDPAVYSRELPPPHAYHYILLFGRNRFVPTLTSPNAFYFLSDNPFVCLDILYIYKCDVKKNKKDKIIQALKGLIEEETGYFYACEGGHHGNLLFIFSQLLGHPMVRCSQNAAQFNISAKEESADK